MLVGKLVGVELWAQGAAGFVAVAGHNWSPFLRMTGGRGVSVAVGAALGLGMFWEILILGLAVFTVGRLLTPRHRILDVCRDAGNPRRRACVQAGVLRSS